MLLDFVNRDPGKPVSIVLAPVDACIAKLMAGEVEAVITDRTVLQWYTKCVATERMRVHAAARALAG